MSDPRPSIVAYEIDGLKITGYLLNLAHPDGGAKAALFLTHRFGPDDLRYALLEHAKTGDWMGTRKTGWGCLFEIRGPLMTPLNRYIDVRAVWAVQDAEPSLAKFVTAYPA